MAVSQPFAPRIGPLPCLGSDQLMLGYAWSEPILRTFDLTFLVSRTSNKQIIGYEWRNTMHLQAVPAS